MNRFVQKIFYPLLLPANIGNKFILFKIVQLFTVMAFGTNSICFQFTYTMRTIVYEERCVLIYKHHQFSGPMNIIWFVSTTQIIIIKKWFNQPTVIKIFSNMIHIHNVNNQMKQIKKKRFFFSSKRFQVVW